MNQWGTEWLNKPIGLRQFYWGAQPQATGPIADYLKAWTEYSLSDPGIKWLAQMGQLPAEVVERNG